MKLKKFIAASAAAAISLCALPAFSVSAAQNNNILALGDSIATGYGASECFGQITSNYLNAPFNNLAVNGLTTSGLLSKVQNENATKNAVTDSDEILISIGGNDYLTVMREIIAPYHKDGDSLETLKNNMKADFANVSAKLPLLTGATNPAIENIQKTVDAIRILNPDANITILTLYNPLDAIDTTDNVGSTLYSLSDSVIDTFNTKLQLIDNVDLVDVYGGFKGNNDVFTKIKNTDPHPTDAGHIKIAALAASKMTGTDYNTVLGTMLGKMNSADVAALPAALTDGIDIIAPQVTTTAATTTATAAQSTTAAPAVTTVPAATTTAAPAATTTAKTTTTPAPKAAAAKATTKVTSSPKTSDTGVGASLAVASFAGAAVIATMLKRKKK